MRSLSLKDKLVYEEIRISQTTKQEFEKLKKYNKKQHDIQESKTYADKARKQKEEAHRRGKSSTSADFLKQ